MTEDLKSLFLIQQSNQSICLSCSSAIIKKSSAFVVYITSQGLHHNPFENYLSEAILLKGTALYCDLCQDNLGDISVLQHFVTPPTFLL